MPRVDTGYTDAGALNGDEKLFVVDDPSGTPGSRNTTPSAIRTYLLANIDADDISVTGTTNKFTTAADIAKLAGIETGADVTDATNVDAAGATMNTDTDVSGNSWVLDEDTMASNSATKVPTQQSVKAYVDASAAGGSLDDLSDVVITGPVTSGDIIRYNGTNWVDVPGTDHYEAAGAVATHSSDTTSVHGIADTSALLDTGDIGVSVQAHSAVLDATTASFTTADETKLDGIEALADVTDATNVAAAGAHMSGGTDVPVADGGTGASTAAGARTNLGLAIGTDVEPASADPQTVTGTTDTLASGDLRRLTMYSNAAAVTVTVPTGTFSAGDWFLLQSTGAGGLSLSTAGITLNGSSPSVGVAQNEALYIEFTAANTITVLGGTSA